MEPPSTHDLRFLQALKAHRAGDGARARALLETVLAEDPDHADSLEVLGMLLSEAGELDRAIELTAHLAQLQPGSVMAHANLSRFHMLQGDKETAEEWQAKARTLGWKEEIARKGTAGAGGGLQRGPDPELVTRQEAAVHERPDDPLARLVLAGSYRKLAMPAKAIAHLRRVLELDQSLSAAYVELGGALEEANLPAEAVEVYRRGIPLAEGRGDLMPRNRMQTRLDRLQRAQKE